MCNYPVWTNKTPSTDRNARITRWRDVKSVTVIQVKNAQYRSSNMLDDFFEMINPAIGIKFMNNGQIRVEVCRAWHGVKPVTSCLNILLDNKNYEIINNYSGRVADNIS